MPETGGEKDPSLLDLFWKYKAEGDEQGASMVWTLIILTGGTSAGAGAMFYAPIMWRLLN